MTITSKYIITVFVILFSSQSIFSQEPDPYLVLEEIEARLEIIQDYQVDLTIELDVDFINMPVKHAVMYYKQPSKVRIKSDDFLLLPKKGFDFSLRELLNEDYSAVFVGTEVIHNKNHYLIKVIPLEKRSKLVLANLWISEEELQIMKLENYTKKRGSYIVDFTYAYEFTDLPSRMLITFEVEDFHFPVKFMGKGVEVDKEKLKEEGPKTGSVIFFFTDYVLNPGLEESVFDDAVEER
ncbi:MAG: hypothetical protein U9R60_00605 [Bacteroidota bacterium]|nr:hypothetical protein [Bacteroidota bacterium]